MCLGFVQQGFYFQQRMKFYMSMYRFIHVLLNGYDVRKKRPKRENNFVQGFKSMLNFSSLPLSLHSDTA